jgi:hypothetical protein
MIEKSALGIWNRSNALSCLPESVHQLSAKSIMTMSALVRNRSNTIRLPSGVIPKTVVLHDGEVIWESEDAGWLNNRILEGVANAEGVSQLIGLQVHFEGSESVDLQQWLRLDFIRPGKLVEAYSWRDLSPASERKMSLSWYARASTWSSSADQLTVLWVTENL